MSSMICVGLSLSLMSKGEIADIRFSFHQCEILPTSLATTLSIHAYTNIRTHVHTRTVVIYVQYIVFMFLSKCMYV